MGLLVRASRVPLFKAWVPLSPDVYVLMSKPPSYGSTQCASFSASGWNGPCREELECILKAHMKLVCDVSACTSLCVQVEYILTVAPRGLCGRLSAIACQGWMRSPRSLQHHVITKIVMPKSARKPQNCVRCAWETLPAIPAECVEPHSILLV